MNATTASIVFDPPRTAQIVDAKYPRFAPTLRQMGLPSQKFRVAATRNGTVIVHPDDLSRPTTEPFMIRKDIVEFTDGSEI